MSEIVDTSQLHWLELTELSRLLRAREISALELTQHFLSRIDNLDERLHSFKLVFRDAALDAAKVASQAPPTSPLHGIPFAIKDAFDVAGYATTMGSRLLSDNVAAQDAHVIRLLRESGMIPLGKTHMVQFAFGGVGINNEDGTPLNPWTSEPYVPGGSSSGSAVAVAAGLAPMSLGTDTGGSIRIPAALCGLTGLKATVGALDLSGVAPLGLTLDSIGPLCRSAEDCSLVFATMAGAPAPVLSPEPNLSGMRLAFAETPVFWNDVDPEVADAVRGTALVFSSLGAAVDSIPFDQAAETQRLNPDGLVTSAEAYAVNRDRLENHFPSCDPLVANRMLFGKEVLAIDYIRALRDWQGLRARVYGYLRDVDALLIPTTAIPAKSLAEVSASGDSYTRINRLYLRNTVIGNVLNFCGLSVPCGFTSSGLPIGLMIYGKPHTEDVILRIGRAYQSVTDFHKRHPSLP